MTPSEQNIAICKARGLDSFQPSPNHTKDLNAMHEAEKVIEGMKNWNRYTDELGKLCHYKLEIHGLRSFANIIVSATASQRAEAFLRTLNLWTE